MTSDDQRVAADRIASEYSGTSRISLHRGPLEDLAVVACPTGRIVVLSLDGSTLADSEKPTIWDQCVVRGLCDPRYERRHSHG